MVNSVKGGDVIWKKRIIINRKGFVTTGFNIIIYVITL